MKNLLRILIGIVTFAFLSGAAWADKLTIGTAVFADTLDPHFSNSPPDLSQARHFFDNLIFFDENQQLKPGLAESWKLLDDQTWELKLRKDVKWHDGAPFTADDVLFTFDRTGKVQGSTSSSLRFFTLGGKKATKVDDYTVRVATDKGYVLTLQDLAVFGIISKKHGTGAGAAEYSSGKAVVGTGPYKFSQYTSGSQIDMVANPDYWGGKPQWDQVVIKSIKSNPSRVAALLSGEVDIIDYVPPEDLEHVRANKNIALHESASNRLIYLELDTARDITPQVKTLSGAPMVNPLRDWRVRKAMSMAIDRNAIISQVLSTMGIPASQMLPQGFFGVINDFPVEKYDLAGAKELLAEAGYGKGFHLTVHGPNDRYVQDRKIIETVAQMLSRLGLKIEVVTLPKSVYFTRSRELEFSVALKGYGSDTGEVGSSLVNVIESYNAEKRTGASNAGRYQNPRVDKAIDEALVTMDDNKRSKLFQEATRISMNDLAIIPLHFQKNVWASRMGIHYVARTDEFTIATYITKGR